MGVDPAASDLSEGGFVVPVACTYEEREDGTVLSTGRLTLERRLAVGDTLRLGRRRMHVAEVLQTGRGELRLVLERV